MGGGLGGLDNAGSERRIKAGSQHQVLELGMQQSGGFYDTAGLF